MLGLRGRYDRLDRDCLLLHVEFAGEPDQHLGLLLAVGHRHNVASHAAKHQADLDIRLAHVLQKRRRVGAVLRCTVARRRAGRGGIGDDAAVAAGLDHSKPARRSGRARPRR